MTGLRGAFDFEIVDEFMDHYELMCEQMEPTILALEHEAGYGENIEGLFRIFHNIKSASGYLHLEQLNHLAAFVEDQLEKARHDPGPASSGFIDWLLLASDQCNTWLCDLKCDHPEFAKINREIFYLPERMERT